MTPIAEYSDLGKIPFITDGQCFDTWGEHGGLALGDKHLGQHIEWPDLPAITFMPPGRPTHEWKGVGVGHTSHGNGNGYGHIDCPPPIPGPGTAALLFVAGAILCTWVRSRLSAWRSTTSA